MKELKKMFAGAVVKIYSQKHNQVFRVNLPKENNNYGLKELCELAETKVHNGFAGVVSEVTFTEGIEYNTVREIETSKNVNLFLVSSNVGTYLKHCPSGITVWSK
jgi:hypothetical protein